MDQHRYMMIACAVLARECYHCAAISKNLIDLTILKQGLHDIGEKKMSSALQREIDAVDIEKYEAILLAYGLCNNGIRNLRSDLPLVVPRAHDCITLLMGSKEDYLKFTEDIIKSDISSALRMIDVLYTEGMDLYTWTGEFLEYLRELLFMKAGAYEG